MVVVVVVVVGNCCWQLLLATVFICLGGFLNRIEFCAKLLCLSYYCCTSAMGLCAFLS